MKKVKKATPKKAAPKKKAVKKPMAKKPAAKKIAAKKAPAKKISKPVVKKAAAKKTVIKKPVIKTAAKPVAKAAVKEESLTAAELKEIKSALVEMRDDALARLREKKEDMPEAEVGDPMDTASQSMDKELLFELSDNSQMLIDQIEAALRKIDKNIYGVCESCRKRLPKKRIKALPFARYCVNCQTTNESRNF